MLHHRDGVLAAKEGRFAHDRAVQPELLECGRLWRGRYHHAGIVDEHIEFAELRDRGRNDLLPTSLIPHILLHERR